MRERIRDFGSTNVSAVIGVSFGQYLHTYAWEKRTTVSALIRSILESWVETQRSKGEEQLATPEQLQQAVRDGVLTAEEAGLAPRS